jgi:hypothetical protein
VTRHFPLDPLRWIDSTGTVPDWNSSSARRTLSRKMRAAWTVSHKVKRSTLGTAGGLTVTPPAGLGIKIGRGVNARTTQAGTAPR